MNLFGLQITKQNKHEFKASDVGQLISLFKLGQAQWTPRDYEKLAQEGYVQNVAVFGSVREITAGFKSLQWQLFSKSRNKKVEITDHPLLTLLKKPNPQQGGASFAESAAGYFLLSGNAYFEAVTNSRGLPIELYTHRPDRMKVVPNQFGSIGQFEYSVNGQKYSWQVDPITGGADVTQWKSFHPLNDWYGMSAIEAAAFSIDTHNKAGAWNKALLDNSARPSGALVMGNGGNLTPGQVTDLKAEIEEKYSGAANTGRPLLLSGGLDWKEMGLSPKDMDHIEGKNMSAREIALAYGIPPQILGIPGDNTYSNQKEARLAMWENTILPHADAYRDELNNWLALYYGDDLRLDYNKDAIEALAPRRQIIWDRVKEATFLTDNEKREAVGYAPIKNGDIIYKPFSAIPAGTTAPEDDSKSLESKFVNLDSADEKAKEWIAANRLMMKFERGMTKEVAKLLIEKAESASEAFKADGTTGAEMSLHGHNQEIKNLLKTHYIGIMDAFGSRTMDAFKHKSVETKDVEDFYQSSVDQWIARFVAGKANVISKTTIDKIFDAIKTGEEQGLTNVEIADLIEEKTAGQAAWSRARVIAQTEVHAAATAASDTAIDAMGFDNAKRVWLSSGDVATRDSHLAATGQKRSMTDPFDIGGAKLMRPGDPAGAPEETIGCRCIVTYEI